MEIFFEKMDTYFILKVTVRAGSKTTAVKGLYGDPPRLKVSLTEVAEDGKANKNLISMISKILKIPKSNISIIRGLTSQNKDIKINVRGLDQQRIVKIINHLY
jgi:hypothetical protein